MGVESLDKKFQTPELCMSALNMGVPSVPKTFTHFWVPTWKVERSSVVEKNIAFMIVNSQKGAIYYEAHIPLFLSIDYPN